MPVPHDTGLVLALSTTSQPRWTVRTGRDGDRVLVEIGDNGPGIPEATAAHILEPFYTTKEVGKGTGLGLDICWRIVVRRHRGDLRFT